MYFVDIALWVVTNISAELTGFLFTLEMIMFLMQRKWPLLTIDDQNGPLSYSLSLKRYISTSSTYLFRLCRWRISDPPKRWNLLTSLQVDKIQKPTIWLLINLPIDWRKNLFRKWSCCCKWINYRRIMWLKFEMPDSIVHLLFYHKNAPNGDCFGKGKCIFTLLSLMQQSRTGGFYFQVVHMPI